MIVLVYPRNNITPKAIKIRIFQHEFTFCFAMKKHYTRSVEPQNDVAVANLTCKLSFLFKVSQNVPGRLVVFISNETTS